MIRKNEATLEYKGKRFIVYQNLRGEWNYTYDNLLDVNTTATELQAALNIIHETIDERKPRKGGKQYGHAVAN